MEGRFPEQRQNRGITNQAIKSWVRFFSNCAIPCEGEDGQGLNPGRLALDPYAAVKAVFLCIVQLKCEKVGRCTIVSEKMELEKSGRRELVNPDAAANVLQATFKHYFEMAMDHHTKAATTSNFLLIIVGAIISFVGFDTVVGGTADLVSGGAVFVIGLFGMVWTRKQFERYTFWQHIARQYQKDLARMVPELKTEDVYCPDAKDAALMKYAFVAQFHERWLWASLHGLVAAIGLGLMVLAA